MSILLLVAADLACNINFGSSSPPAQVPPAEDANPSPSLGLNGVTPEKPVPTLTPLAPTEEGSTPPLEPSEAPPPTPDVADEVFWSGGGGGVSRPDACDSGNVVFWILTSSGSGPDWIAEHPYRNVTPDHGAYGVAFHFEQCNLPEGTLVTVSFHLPDGQTVTTNDSVGSSGRLDIDWISIPTEPPGLYTADISGGGHHTQLSFNISAAQVPLVRSICQLPGYSTNVALLTGFDPDEQVLVMLYDLPNPADASNLDRWTFHDYRTVTVDGQGNAFVELTEPNIMIVAAGEHPDFYWGETANGQFVLVDGFDEAFCKH